ncbi:MAG: SH3 domain-containing protein [Pseudobdellovibrio sp.]
MILILISPFAFAVQKAKIFNEQTEIYSDADFDAEVIDEVYKGEVYFISSKTYGPFYRIKLKNGKIGYIPDTEVDIEGKGRIKPKDLDAEIFESEKKYAEMFGDQDDEEMEEGLFGITRAGPTLQLINFHENTLGSDQIDNLLAYGYKSVSDIAWSVLGTFSVPKYYEEKTGGTARGVKLWADMGFSSPITDFGSTEIRYSATIFTHISAISLDTPTRKYDLQDITLGLALEVGWMIKIKRSAIDLAIKYYFDKSSYAGFGLSYLF